MNKWLFRAVGTVGVASGFWLLGGAAAHAHEATAAPVTDPQALRGLLNNLLSPTSGLSDLGLSVDLPGHGVDAGLDAKGPLQLRANDGRTGVTTHLPQRQDVFLGGRLPDLARSVPAVSMLPGERTEVLGGLGGLGGITDGLTGSGGAGGLLGGVTGSSGPLNVVTGLTHGGPLAGLTGGLTGGSAGGSATGGENGGILGGLTGGDSGGVLGGLTGSLGGVTGGDSGGLLGGLTGKLGGLTGGLTGGDAAAQPAQQPQLDPTAFGLTQGDPSFDPSQFDPAQFDPQFDPSFDPSQFDLSQVDDPAVQTSDGTPADLDPAFAGQLTQAGQNLVPTMIAQAAANVAQGGTQAPSPFDLDWDLGDDSMVGDDALLGDDLAGLDPSMFFADNPNVAVKMVAPESIPVVDGLPLVGPILGDQGLGKIIVVGNLAQKLPVVGSVLNGQGLPSLDNVPVVNQVMNRGILSDGRSAGLPVVGSVPMVGDLLGGGTGGLLGGLTGGDSGGILGGLTGSLGGDALGGDALGGLTGGLTGGESPLGGITGGLLGGTQGEPMRALPAPGMITARPALAGPTAITRVAAPNAHAARHTETDRPVAGDDAEFPSRGESAESGLPLVGQLPGLSLGRTLSQLPVVSDLPIVGSLPAATGVLRSLPLVGTVASLLPLD